MSMYLRPAISLEDKVLQKLMFEPAIDSSKIHVLCAYGVVTLWGAVSSLFEKNVAERAVRSLKDVKEVVNKLQVDLIEEQKRSDADILNAVVNTLKWNVSVPKDVIKVSVENGEVTLKGNVKWWYQKNSAEKAISNIIGILSINNQIGIYPAPTPKNVKKKIMEEFHRNASIDANKINVNVIGNNIILKGNVCSGAEIKEAVRAAWSIPGVIHVDNQLTLI